MTQQSRNAFVIDDPSEILKALVGLKDVRVIHLERRGAHVELCIEQVVEAPRCPSCGLKAKIHERPVVRLVDLPVYGQAMTLAWKKHRLRCRTIDCPIKTWVLDDPRIGATACLLTTRAAKWATMEVGQGRTVNEVAVELGCDWHTVNAAVVHYGAALLAADKKRLNRTRAIGLDETNFVRLHEQRTSYATTIADVEHHQIIEILPTRRFDDVAGWIDAQSEAWRERIEFGALDMSDAYAAVYTVMLPNAAQVVDPFHVIAMANRSLDTIRRRVQVQQLGHRGRKDDPLYSIRRLLLRGEERLSDDAKERLQAMLSLGDPDAEVAIAYRVKERLRDFYRATDIDDAHAILEDLIEHCRKRSMPNELQRLGRTLRKWFQKILNHHVARVTNAPTEALNNLIKRIKRIGFGFRNFENYRIRALLYAGKPNWRVLGSIVVR